MQKMQPKISLADCIDVRAVGQPIEPGLFELRGFVPDVDYADVEDQTWIWSIGRRRRDGRIFAAVDIRFFQNPDYDCLWLK
jgi:hypothetical protein